jgi:hypothetical protein
MSMRARSPWRWTPTPERTASPPTCATVTRSACSGSRSWSSPRQPTRDHSLAVGAQPWAEVHSSLRLARDHRALTLTPPTIDPALAAYPCNTILEFAALPELTPAQSEARLRGGSTPPHPFRRLLDRAVKSRYRAR